MSEKKDVGKQKDQASVYPPTLNVVSELKHMLPHQLEVHHALKVQWAEASEQTCLGQREGMTI